MVNIGFGGQGRPHVPYATAMDTFIILCFIAVFAGEGSFTNYVDKFLAFFDHLSPFVYAFYLIKVEIF